MSTKFLENWSVISKLWGFRAGGGLVLMWGLGDNNRIDENIGALGRGAMSRERNMVITCTNYTPLYRGHVLKCRRPRVSSRL